MKIFFYTLSFLFLVFSTACSASEHKPHKSYPVKWYSGYALQQYLAKTTHIDKTSELLKLINMKWGQPIPVHKPGKKTIINLNTCQDYFNAKQKSLQPVNDADFSPFVELVLMCQATRAIAEATPSRISTFTELKFDKKLPSRLPAKMAMITSETESHRILSNKAIKSMAQVNKILKVIHHSRFDVTYVESTQDNELELVAKGDFNHDGIEDYLVSSLGSVHGGTYTAFRLFLITRRPGQANYTLLKEYEY